MFCPKIFQATVLLIFLNATMAATDLENCKFPCEEYDQRPVCTLDKNNVCFRILPSKCYLDLLNCVFQLGYMIYIDSYCEMEAFKCKDDLFVQSPPASTASATDDFVNTSQSLEYYSEIVQY